MVSNFKLYSAYYDLLYEDKDYQSEVTYLNRHIRQLLPDSKELLELGSGTGSHARYLSTSGYHIVGVERSEDMIAIAKQKSIPNFQPVLSDIMNFQLGRQFDVAVSMFHSMCYLTGNDQLLTAFGNISRHIKPGGYFIFDIWYAPAVLHHLPVNRTKYKQNDLIEVRRHGETTMFINDNVAEVDYEVVVTDKSSGRSEVIREKHPMRYFTIPEITFLAEQTGFKMAGFEEFLTGNEPTLESWNLLVTLHKPAL